MRPQGKTLAAALLWPLLAAGAAWAFAPLAPAPAETRALAGLKGRARGEIVFTSRRDGPWRLYRINADGTGLARLSRGRANERRPLWIKDGAELVFQSDRAGVDQVWLAGPDLSGARPLSPPGRAEWLQGVSADGSRLLVRTGGGPRDYLLRLLPAGRDLPVDFSALGVEGGWLDAILSPDGQRLAALYDPRRGGRGRRGVYVMELAVGDGGARARAPRAASDGCGAGWAPDSRSFLTCRTVHGGSDLWLAGLDGGLTRVTSRKNWDYFPAFGPDGSWIAWAASPLDQHDHGTGNYELYVRPLKGGEPVRLTFHSAPDQDPAWRARRGPPLPSAGASRHYEAELHTRGPRYVRADPTASGGRAAFAGPDAPAGALVYGQYDTLPPGRYRAVFRLRLQRPAPAARVSIDVAVEGGRRVLARAELSGAELPVGAYGEKRLEFTLERPVRDLELRVDPAPGQKALWVDFVAVEEAPPGLGGYLLRLMEKAFGPGR